MTYLNAGTLHLADEELVRKIEGCTLECEFHHADHIRLAWIYLRMMPAAEAEERMASTLRRYSAHKGKPERYHHTMTLAWMRLVAAARRATPELNMFEDFIAAHPHLLDQDALATHYSQEILRGDTARTRWVNPDLCPLLPS
jgi:hypothetical protein